MHILLLKPQDIVLTGFLLLNIACHQIKGSTCPNDDYGVKVYGSTCEFVCHCVNTTEQCDDVTGSCASGCAFEWLGRGCQYRNIARTSPVTRHMDNVAQQLWAPRAIDKNVNTCSETATANSSTAISRKEPPWWRTWWPNEELFRVIVISTRQPMLGYFTNFSVYVEDNPYRFNQRYYKSRKICYKHDGWSLLTTTMTVTCRQPLRGNQVRIQLASNQTQLVLCDVRMFGECNEYECGTDCSIPCHCAVVTFNNNVTGDCLEGCAVGWTGQGYRCDAECDNGTYGVNCSGHCHCEDNDICDNVYGHCPRGCAAGWNGDTCDTECTYGTFGENCTFNCSGHCEGNVTCNHVNGSCVDGCEPGWTGSHCISEQNLTAVESWIYFVGPVVGSVVGMLLAASGLIFGVVFYKSRHNKNPIYQQQLDTRTTQESSLENVYMNSLATAVGKGPNMIPTKTDKIEDSEISLIHNECQYYNMDENREAPFSLPQHGIYISQLMTFLQKQSKNNQKLVSEFEEIPTTVLYPNTNAMKSENRQKNRYKKMYPYDFNRVVLEPDEREASDYINASYVDGYKRQRAYIATQGPTHETINDFWRLIWQQKTQVVVMVTQLYENEKMKCQQYWDPSGPVTFGDITVTVVFEEQFAEYTIRSFKAQSARSQSSLLVQQYHYTAWPDKACPEGTASLLCFWGRVNKDNPKTNTPWLVHCSAGVGRTGTFIALDILISQGRDTGYVDVYGCVEALRQQRVFMVQTKDQYIYLHELLLDALVLEALPMSTSDYLDMYNTGNLEVSWNLCQEAKRISRDRLYPSDDYESDLTFKAGLTEENLSKNRDVTIIPENMYRPFLSIFVDGSTNYINAVFMPSYRRKHGFILTQTPLPTTTADWWRLVHQHKIQTVLAIDDALADEEVGQYLPSTDSETIGPFRVDRVSKEEDSSDAYFFAKYQATYKEETHAVTHITYKQWPCDEAVPISRQTLLQLCNDVMKIQFTSQGSPLLIQCRDGATRSGLMAVLLYALDRLQVEEEVAVLQILRHLGLRRPQIVPNKEQFLFVNTVIKEQIENTGTYANL